MFLTLVCLFATAAAAPATYDQRQDGELNIQADVQNILFLIALPKKVPLSLQDLFSKNHKPLDGEHDIQERSDVRVMEAFVEPSTPYRVEIGAGDRSPSDGRAVEIVIAGRHRLETDSQEHDDMKLLGAMENCGPDRVRNPVTLTCETKPVKTNDDGDLQTNDKEDEVKSQTPQVVLVTS